MSLFIGRNPATREVEVRNYKEGATPPSGFRSPKQCIERIEELERLLRAMKADPKQKQSTQFDSLFKGFGF